MTLKQSYFVLYRYELRCLNENCELFNYEIYNTKEVMKVYVDNILYCINILLHVL